MKKLVEARGARRSDLPAVAVAEAGLGIHTGFVRMGASLSILLYAFGLVAAVAALALIRPISWLGLRTRRRALVAWLLAIAGGVGTLAWPTHETRVASPVSRLDQIVPLYQFSEVHETTIEASPERTYRTICAVTVNEIALLRTLTYIRRFGQPRPDSILNPPGDKPFCEVALSSGFYLLADEPPSEMVLGHVCGGAEGRTGEPTAPDYGRDIHRDSLAGLCHRCHEFSAAIHWIDSDAADHGDARVRNRCDDSQAFCRILACHLSRQLNHSDDVVASHQAERRVARGLQLALYTVGVISPPIKIRSSGLAGRATAGSCFLQRGFVFPHAGCWRIEASRDDTHATFWLNVE